MGANFTVAVKKLQRFLAKNDVQQFFVNDKKEWQLNLTNRARRNLLVVGV